jgi:hypothetical protein
VLSFATACLKIVVMMTRTVGAFVTVVAAAASSVSCGGGGGGTCAMVAACGGDVVGNWRITSSCLKATGTFDIPDNPDSPSCTGAPVNASLQATGNISYTAALTYSSTIVISGTESIGFSGACLTFNGVTVTCDQLNQAFATMPPDPAFSAIHCTAAGGGCNCVVALSGMMTNESGTYTTSGGTITLTPSGGPPEAGAGYCVKGNQLDLTPPASMMAGLTSSGDLTLTRQ